MPTTSEVDYETLSSEAPYLTGETETTSSQSTLPEEDISIWFDEKEEQNSKRQALNDGFESESTLILIQSPLMCLLKRTTRHHPGKRKGKYCRFLQTTSVAQNSKS